MSSSVISSCRETGINWFILGILLAPEAVPVSILLNSPPLFDWYSLHLLNQQRSDRPFLCHTQEIRGRFNNVALCRQRSGAETKKKDTYSVSDCFSVKTLRTKSASLWGSKVEGTIRYSPGGRRRRVLTSRRLMKVSERAHEEWLKKKFFFKWTFWQPLNWGGEKMHLHISINYYSESHPFLKLLLLILVLVKYLQRRFFNTEVWSSAIGVHKCCIYLLWNL